MIQNPTQRATISTDASQSVNTCLVRGFRGIGLGIVATLRSITTSAALAIRPMRLLEMLNVRDALAGAMHARTQPG